MRFPAHAATTPKSINKHTEGKWSFAGRKATQCYAKLVDLTETAEECLLSCDICDIKLSTILIKIKINKIFCKETYRGLTKVRKNIEMITFSNKLISQKVLQNEKWRKFVSQLGQFN
jgi:hypothetical protein